MGLTNRPHEVIPLLIFIELFKFSTNFVIAKLPPMHTLINMFRSIPKVYFRVVLGLFVIGFLILAIWYYNSIKIYEPLNIRVENNLGKNVGTVKVYAIQPLGKEVLLKKDETTSLWECGKTKGSYYRGLRLVNTHSKPDTLQLSVTNMIGDVVYRTATTAREIMVNPFSQPTPNEQLKKFEQITGYNALYLALSLLTACVVFFLFKKNKQLRIINHSLVYVALIYGYVMLFMASFYAFPNAEDLSLAAEPRNFGVLTSVLNLLLYFDGRYFTNVLHGVSFLSLGSVYSFKFIPIFSIILAVGAVFFFVKVLFGKELSYAGSLLFSLVFVLSHFALIPSLSHSLYFAGSSFVYLWSWIFFCFWGGFTVLLFKASLYKIKFLYYVGSHVFLVCTLGINEMFLVVFTLLTVLALLYVFFYRRSLLAEVIPLAITAATCIFFFVSTPGPYQRLNEFFPGERNMAYFYFITTQNASHHLAELLRWISSSLMWPAFMLFFVLYLYPHINKALNVQRYSKHMFFVAIIVFIVMFAAAFAYYYPMGVSEIILSHRLYNFQQWPFQFVFFVLVPLIGVGRFSVLFERHNIMMKRLLSGVLILMLFFMFEGNNNLSLIRHELSSGELQQYRHEMLNRYTIIKQAENSLGWKKAVVEPLLTTPESVYFPPEIMPHKALYIWNNAYVSYFNIDEISLTGDTVTVATLLDSIINEQNRLSDTY
jgi:hypothetical protein